MLVLTLLSSSLIRLKKVPNKYYKNLLKHEILQEKYKINLENNLGKYYWLKHQKVYGVSVNQLHKKSNEKPQQTFCCNAKNGIFFILMVNVPRFDYKIIHF